MNNVEKEYLAKAEKITTKEQAQAFAQEWQQWASVQNLSYGELAEWGGVFAALAERFDLVEEFTENGIL